MAMPEPGKAPKVFAAVLRAARTYPIVQNRFKNRFRWTI